MSNLPSEETPYVKGQDFSSVKGLLTSTIPFGKTPCMKWQMQLVKGGLSRYPIKVHVVYHLETHLA